MKSQRWVLTFLLAAIALQSLHYYPQLPDTVASHFGPAGQPNAWSYKWVFFWTYLGMVFLMVLVFFGLPVLYRRFPSATMNLPHKQYWLAPERREQSLGFFNGQLHWMGNATLAFMLGIFQLAIQANLPPRSGLAPGGLPVCTGGLSGFRRDLDRPYLSPFPQTPLTRSPR